MGRFVNRARASVLDFCMKCRQPQTEITSIVRDVFGKARPDLLVLKHLWMQIGIVGDHGLRLFNPATNQHCILPVEVSLNGTSFLVTVGKEAEQPPYRIENRSVCHLQYKYPIGPYSDSHISIP